VRDLHLVRDGLALLNGVDRQRALLAVQLVRKLGVVLDVRDADLGVVAVEDAGDFLESGAPVVKTLLVKHSVKIVGSIYRGQHTWSRRRRTRRR
jgi:hypothetical protein